MAGSLVPVNLSVADVHAQAELRGAKAESELADISKIEIPKVTELSNWAQEAYSLDVSAATEFGFPVGNLSTDYKRQALMFGSSRWKDVTVGNESYRFGVALRAIIVVTEVRGSGALTLPVLAAKVEIEGARATAQLMIRGYKDSKLASSLPSWQSFGVDSYAQYMKTVSDIQKMILEDESGIQPELLATTLLAPGLPSSAAAVGSVFALHAIADGLNLAQAIQHLEDRDTEVIKTLQTLYQARLGADQWRKPSNEDRASALDELYGLHIGHPLPWAGLFRQGQGRNRQNARAGGVPSRSARE